MLSKLSNSKFLIPAMVTIALLAAISGFYISLIQSQSAASNQAAIQGVFWPNPKQINNFSSKDQNGNEFGLNELKGKWSFMFFGYTHCPDICPITLSVMAESYKSLEQAHPEIQTIFVSVDPARDSTEKLSQYVGYFNDDFIGLSADLKDVNGLTRQIGIAYVHNQSDANGNYLVDHSSSIFLIDPLGRLIGKISAPHNKEKIIQQFTKTKEFINAQS